MHDDINCQHLDASFEVESSGVVHRKALGHRKSFSVGWIHTAADSELSNRTRKPRKRKPEICADERKHTESRRDLMPKGARHVCYRKGLWNLQMCEMLLFFLDSCPSFALKLCKILWHLRMRATNDEGAYMDMWAICSHTGTPNWASCFLQ
jgi:hypothetical protein